MGHLRAARSLGFLLNFFYQASPSDILCYCLFAKKVFRISLFLRGDPPNIKLAMEAVISPLHKIATSLSFRTDSLDGAHILEHFTRHWTTQHK